MPEIILILKIHHGRGATSAFGVKDPFALQVVFVFLKSDPLQIFMNICANLSVQFGILPMSQRDIWWVARKCNHRALVPQGQLVGIPIRSSW